jgi:hypothetical protein
MKHPSVLFCNNNQGVRNIPDALVGNRREEGILPRTWCKGSFLSNLVPWYADELRGRRGEKKGTLIGLSVPEVRWLLVRLVWPQRTTEKQVLAWSGWRRAHQARARACHYRKRGAEPP